MRYIILQILIKRKEFKIINLFQIFFSSLFGFFVDLAKKWIGDFTLPGYLGQLFLLIVSILIISIGVYLYLHAGLVKMPMEGLAMAINDKLPKRQFFEVKIVLDCSSVLIALILSLLFLGTVQGIREGTVLSAIAIGKLLPIIAKMEKKLLDRVYRK